jgi:hypothetical protein
VEKKQSRQNQDRLKDTPIGPSRTDSQDTPEERPSFVEGQSRKLEKTPTGKNWRGGGPIIPFLRKITNPTLYWRSVRPLLAWAWKARDLNPSDQMIVELEATINQLPLEEGLQYALLVDLGLTPPPEDRAEQRQLEEQSKVAWSVLQRLRRMKPGSNSRGEIGLRLEEAVREGALNPRILALFDV